MPILKQFFNIKLRTEHVLQCLDSCSNRGQSCIKTCSQLVIFDVKNWYLVKIDIFGIGCKCDIKQNSIKLENVRMLCSD